MKKYVLVLAMLAVPAMAFGQTASMSLVVGGSSEITADGLDSGVLLELVIDSADTNVAGYDVWLTASQAGVLSLSGETKSVITGFVYGSANGTLNPTSGTTSGLNMSGDTPPSAWPATIISWTLTSIGDLDLPVTIDIGTNLSAAGGVAFEVSKTSLEIVPEPATMLLLAGALPFLRRRRA